MSWLDWTIVIIPLIVVYALGIYSSRYANSVADFLSAGRLCGRYVIAVGDIANALSIINKFCNSPPLIIKIKLFISKIYHFFAAA